MRTLLLTLLLAGAALAAPAPRCKTDGLREGDLMGVYSMPLNGGHAFMELSSGGAYLCHWHGRVYRGTWSARPAGVLVKERCEECAPFSDWHVTAYRENGRVVVPGLKRIR